MKSLLLIIFSLVSLSAYAWDMPNPFKGNASYTTSVLDLKKSAEVVIKDGRCSFATVEWPRPNAPEVIANILKQKAHSFRCVGDIALNPNTLKEQSGCAIFRLDGNTLQTQPLNQYADYPMAPGKKCAEGGFEELMARKVMGIGALGGGLVSSSDYAGESILVYSENPKFVEWFKQAKAKDEVETKAQFEKHKSEQGFPRYHAGYQDEKGTPLKEIISGDPLLKNGSP